MKNTRHLKPLIYAGAILLTAGCAHAADTAATPPDAPAAAVPGPPDVAAVAPPLPSPNEGLKYTLNETGIGSLTYGGQEFIGDGSMGPNLGGLIRAFPPTFRRADGTTYQGSNTPTASAMDKETGTLKISYDWGSVSCTYGQKADRLEMKLAFQNSSADTLTTMALIMMEPIFPIVPNGNVLDAGMFGYAFKYALHPLHAFPLIADSRAMPPLVQIDYGNGSLVYASEGLKTPSGVAVPNTMTLDKKRYLFVASLNGDVAPGKTGIVPLSLRFGAPGATVEQLAGDVLKSYREMYPMQLVWKDRRAIGSLFLAGLGRVEPNNPRQWILNNGQVDTSTDAGKAEFRKYLLQFADNSVAVLKKNDAQGMVTWDVEGQEFQGSTYYGDPRLVSRLAPEMEWKPSPDAPATIDAYFQKFRDAGLKTGVCLRPQKIVFNKDGVPIQTDATNAESAATLNAKVEYAKKRWGCTLYYVDSTVDAAGALDADVFRDVNKAHPDVLLMPENENLRYYAYSAPLNSFYHHRIAATPEGARMTYPGATSVLMAVSGETPEERVELIKAVRAGTILMFNSWYDDPSTDVKAIYDAAKTEKP